MTACGGRLNARSPYWIVLIRFYLVEPASQLTPMTSANESLFIRVDWCLFKVIDRSHSLESSSIPRLSFAISHDPSSFSISSKASSQTSSSWLDEPNAVSSWDDRATMIRGNESSFYSSRRRWAMLNCRSIEMIRVSCDRG